VGAPEPQEAVCDPGGNRQSRVTPIAWGQEDSRAFAYVNPMTCFRCEDTRWVCENHPERPWEGQHACGCGGAGAPCPGCNKVEPPLLPPGYKVDADTKGWRC
jgi:hypothetical protein